MDQITFTLQFGFYFIVLVATIAICYHIAQVWKANELKTQNRAH